MKRTVVVCVLLAALFLHPALVSAHAGAGPPFLKVNGTFAQTNPYYQGDAAINIPQDIAPEAYLVNTPVHFAVDTSQLLVPQDIVSHVLFRWSEDTGPLFFDTNNKTTEGKTLDKTFTKPGSYLLVLESEGPGEYQYSVIDTVQVDIVPKMSYIRPKLTIDIGAPDTRNDFTALYVSKPTVDSSSKDITYLWDLGDKNIIKGQVQKRDYSSASPISYLYNRVIDSNGFVTDVGIDVWKNDTSLEFHPFGNMLNAPIHVQAKDKVAQGSSAQVKKTNGPMWIIVGVGGGIVLFVLVVLFLPKRKVS